MVAGQPFFLGEVRVVGTTLFNGDLRTNLKDQAYFTWGSAFTCSYTYTRSKEFYTERGEARGMGAQGFTIL